MAHADGSPPRARTESRLSLRRRRDDVPRQPTRLQIADGTLIAGDARRPLPSDATPDEVLDHYLAFIREMRGAGKLADVPLRDADLDALAQALGGSAREIERRLIELIQCSRREARQLRRAILKRQMVVPVAGVAIGIGGLGSAAAMQETGAVEHDRHRAVPSRTIDLDYEAPAPEIGVPATVEAPEATGPSTEDVGTPAPPTNNAGEPITRSGSGDDWAEVIAPVVITPDDAEQ